MNRALIAKAANDSKLLFAAICVLMFAFPGVYLWVTGMISLPAFSDFLMNALPKQWQSVWGVPLSQVATPAGRAALLFVHPIVLTAGIAWAIARGSDCVSGEIDRGTMELLLAQPVRRGALYGASALSTSVGSLLLALAVWCGTAIGLRTSSLYEQVSAWLFIPPAVNLLALLVCVAGIATFISSIDNQRWRTIGIVAALYVASGIIALVANIGGRWRWLSYVTFMSAYKPQLMVAQPENAWSLLTYRDGAIFGLGLGCMPLILFGLGIVTYAAGALIFSRRDIPAPL